HPPDCRFSSVLCCLLAEPCAFFQTGLRAGVRSDSLFLLTGRGFRTAHVEKPRFVYPDVPLPHLTAFTRSARLVVTSPDRTSVLISHFVTACPELDKPVTAPKRPNNAGLVTRAFPSQVSAPTACYRTRSRLALSSPRQTGDTVSCPIWTSGDS